MFLKKGAITNNLSRGKRNPVLLYLCVISKGIDSPACADSESIVKGVQLWLFLVDEGSKDPNTTISGPSSARQRKAISI